MIIKAKQLIMVVVETTCRATLPENFIFSSGFLFLYIFPSLTGKPLALSIEHFEFRPASKLPALLPFCQIKMEASHQLPCPRTQQASLPACPPQYPLCPERQAGKLLILFFKFFDDSTKEMNPRSTDCETGALTTRPSRRLNQ